MAFQVNGGPVQTMSITPSTSIEDFLRHNCHDTVTVDSEANCVFPAASVHLLHKLGMATSDRPLQLKVCHPLLQHLQTEPHRRRAALSHEHQGSDATRFISCSTCAVATHDAASCGLRAYLNTAGNTSFIAIRPGAVCVDRVGHCWCRMCGQPNQNPVHSGTAAGLCLMTQQRLPLLYAAHSSGCVSYATPCDTLHTFRFLEVQY